MPQRTLEQPHPLDRYVMGVDVGGGVGGDYSALVVVSVGTLQPVYIQRSNQVSPRDWAHEVVRIATRYNGALILTESNNHGHAVLELRSLTLPPGKATPEAPPGSHDDLAMSCALAYRALRDVPPSWRTQGHHATKQRAEQLIDKARARRRRSHGSPF